MGRKPIRFGDALAEPFNEWTRMLYVLWNIVPIFGSLAFYGWFSRYIIYIVEGRRSPKPKMQLVSDFGGGLKLFLLSIIPSIVNFVILAVVFLLPVVLGLVSAILGFLLSVLLFIPDLLAVGLVYPILVVNFFYERTMGSLMAWKKGFAIVFRLSVGNIFGLFFKTQFMLLIVSVLWIVAIGGFMAPQVSMIFVADYYGIVRSKAGRDIESSE